jgi:hypothetical protein
LSAAFRRADRQAFFAARIAAGLTRVEPVLHGTREQAVGDIPDIGLFVAVGNLIAQIDGFAEGIVERVGILLHGVSGWRVPGSVSGAILQNGAVSRAARGRGRASQAAA